MIVLPTSTRCLFVGVSDWLTAIVNSLRWGEHCELPKEHFTVVWALRDMYRRRRLCQLLLFQVCPSIWFRQRHVSITVGTEQKFVTVCVSATVCILNRGFQSSCVHPIIVWANRPPHAVQSQTGVLLANCPVEMNADLVHFMSTKLWTSRFFWVRVFATKGSTSRPHGATPKESPTPKMKERSWISPERPHVHF